MKKTIKQKISEEKQFSPGQFLIYRGHTYFFVKYLEKNKCIITGNPDINDTHYQFPMLLSDIRKKSTSQRITLNGLRTKAADFSDFAFGKNRTALMPIKKLQEEIQELEECLEKGEEPDSEYADLLLILIDSFRKYYGDDVDMQYWLDACSEKLDINYTRDWSFNEKDKVYRHVKPE